MEFNNNNDSFATFDAKNCINSKIQLVRLISSAMKIHSIDVTIIIIIIIRIRKIIVIGRLILIQNFNKKRKNKT